MSSEQLCLRWNNFETNIASFLDILRSGQDFVDVTITCENSNFKAHKLVLSACSPYFKGIFQEIPCPHPVIILKEVRPLEMEAILRYMYTGETHVAEEGLQSFLHTAALLQVVGLSHCTSASGNHPTNPVSAASASNPTATPLQPPLKKRTISDTQAAENSADDAVVMSDNSNEPITDASSDFCPILSKQLLLPKKRKLESVLDQNKNIELCSDHSDASEGDVPAKLESMLHENEKNNERESDRQNTDDEDHNHMIDGSEEQDGCILEPEVGLSIKEEPSDSEDSLPNGDILLQRLQSSGNNDTRNEDNRILRVPNPDVSIFSQRLSNPSISPPLKDVASSQESERLTLAPNVDIFLKNSNSREHLLARLGRMNLFKKRKCGGGARSHHSAAADREDPKLHLTNLPCPHCAQLYNNLSALKYHVRLMHSDLENKLFCYLCPMSFLERDFFKLHLWEAHQARF